MSETMREMHEAEKRVKAARQKMREWKKETMKSSSKRAEKKRLEEQLKRVKLEVQKEAEATKLQGKVHGENESAQKALTPKSLVKMRINPISTF